MHIYHLHIKGLVQGVGFRPFIYRIANQMNLAGQIKNNNEGVEIEIEASEELKDIFIKAILREKPIASSIDQIDINKEDRIPYRNKFSIVKSQNISENVTSISPDIAVCEQCLQEMETQQNRIDYPFINCTNCGPRFTIIKEIPYDRASTSMDQFTMCPDCYKEYTLITDRRFHAQPTACNNCGPFYYLTKPKKGNSFQYRYASAEKVFQSLAKRISAGEIISLKGLGGYNLICDAFNPQAIKTLRKIKQRDKKPFALMFRTIEKASCFAR
ncbi:MAG: acylphosphatase, partial [Bacteroidales bacterium]